MWDSLDFLLLFYFGETVLFSDKLIPTDEIWYFILLTLNSKLSINYSLNIHLWMSQL